MATELAATLDGPALAVRPARVNIFARAGNPEDQAETDRAMGGSEAATSASAGLSLGLTQPEREDGAVVSALCRAAAHLATAAVVAVLFMAIPTDPPPRGAATVRSAPRTGALLVPVQTGHPPVTGGKARRPR